MYKSLTKADLIDLRQSLRMGRFRPWRLCVPNDRNIPGVEIRRRQDGKGPLRKRM